MLEATYSGTSFPHEHWVSFFKGILPDSQDFQLQYYPLYTKEGYFPELKKQLYLLEEKHLF
jgi:hypothetical protein